MRRLGAVIVAANFNSITICTGKRNITAAVRWARRVHNKLSLANPPHHSTHSSAPSLSLPARPSCLALQLYQLPNCPPLLPARPSCLPPLQLHQLPAGGPEAAPPLPLAGASARALVAHTAVQGPLQLVGQGVQGRVHTAVLAVLKGGEEEGKKQEQLAASPPPRDATLTHILTHAPPLIIPFPPHLTSHTHAHTRTCTHAHAHTHMHTRTCTHAHTHIHHLLLLIHFQGRRGGCSACRPAGTCR